MSGGSSWSSGGILKIKTFAKDNGVGRENEIVSTIGFNAGSQQHHTRGGKNGCKDESNMRGEDIIRYEPVS